MSMDSHDLWQPECGKCGFLINRNVTDAHILTGGIYFHLECAPADAEEDTYIPASHIAASCIYCGPGSACHCDREEDA
jgi:hypothetical protein